MRNLSSSFVIDGEAVLLGMDGISDFNGLHSRRHDDEIQLYVFDILSLDGEDLRKLPLTMRKANLAGLLARRPEGVRTGRDWAGPVSQGLRVWSGGFSVQASG